MVKDVSYSEEDLIFILTSMIGNNLASKKKKNFKLDLYPRTHVVPAMFKVKVDSQRVVLNDSVEYILHTGSTIWSYSQ